MLRVQPLSLSTIVYCFAAALYLPILVALPKAHHAYYSGYWLPRLVMPSLLSFLLLGALVINPRVERSRCGRRFVVAYAVVLATAFLVALG